MANSVISKDYIAESQTISVSGFDGTKKETLVTFTPKAGYIPYVMNVLPNTFTYNNYIFCWSRMNETTGKIYIEHNLVSTVSEITAQILFVKK